MQKERYQSQINQKSGTVCHTEVCLTFLTFLRLAAKLSELITKLQGCCLKIQHQLSMTSKTTLPYVSKIASNQCICSKFWWELWIVGRDRKKSKSPQQWGVALKVSNFASWFRGTVWSVNDGLSGNLWKPPETGRGDFR